VPELKTRRRVSRGLREGVRRAGFGEATSGPAATRSMGCKEALCFFFFSFNGRLLRRFVGAYTDQGDARVGNKTGIGVQKKDECAETERELSGRSEWKGVPPWCSSPFPVLLAGHIWPSGSAALGSRSSPPGHSLALLLSACQLMVSVMPRTTVQGQGATTPLHRPPGLFHKAPNRPVSLASTTPISCLGVA
jgi:hypothetical protein